MTSRRSSVAAVPEDGLGHAGPQRACRRAACRTTSPSSLMTSSVTSSERLSLSRNEMRAVSRVAVAVGREQRVGGPAQRAHRRGLALEPLGDEEARPRLAHTSTPKTTCASRVTGGSGRRSECPSSWNARRPRGSREHSDHADRAPVADHRAGRPSRRPNLRERRQRPVLLLQQRLPLREAELFAGRAPCRIEVRLRPRDLLPQSSLEASAEALGQPRVDLGLQPDSPADDLGRLPRARRSRDQSERVPRRRRARPAPPPGRDRVR